MRSIKLWTLAALGSLLIVAATAAAGGGSLLHAQQQGKPALSKEDADKRAKRKALFFKTYPTAKTSLGAAVATAEKETKARAHSVEYTLTKDDKLTIEVSLVVNDKNKVVFVDPDTGKMAASNEEEEEEGEEEGEGD